MAAQQTGRVPVLSGSDIQIIAQGATTLPGNWYLDHVIDLRRWGKPRVWIRKRAFPDSDQLSVRFERIGEAIWISVHDPRTSQSDVSDGLPFATLAAAFVYLWGRMAATAVAMDAGSEGTPDKPLSLSNIVE